MAWGASEIAELKERVARIAPDNVPRETATPKLRVEFDDKRVAEAPAALDTEIEITSRGPDEIAQEEARRPVPESKPQVKPSGIAATPAIDDDEHKDALGKVERDERALEARLLDMARKADPGDLHDLHAGSGYRSRVVNGQENEKSARQRKKQQDNSFTYQLLQQQLQQQLDVIDAEISRIDARVADIDKQLDEIDDAKLAMDELEELQTNGKLDPNNPRHAALLRRAEIDPDEVEEDNLDVLLVQRRQELEQQEQALTSERDKLLEDRQQLQTTRDKLAEAKDKLDANPDSPAALAEAQEVYEQGKAVTAEMVDQRVEVIGTEAELFAVQLEQIAAPAGSPEYFAQVDAIIEGLTQNTKRELMDDPNTDQSVADRMRVDLFERQYQKLDAFKADPEKYQVYLERMVEKQLDPRTKQLLLEDDATPADVRAALEKEQASATASMDEGRVQKFMQSYSQASTLTDQEGLRKLAETLTAEERTVIESDPDAKAALEALETPPAGDIEPARTAVLAVKVPSI